jgi:hypothetical protein
VLYKLKLITWHCLLKKELILPIYVFLYYSFEFSNRWQQRANELIERSNKTSPEDVKRMTQENENLNKQLKQEKEQNKIAKAKLEEQVKF